MELSETEKQRIDSAFFSVDDPVMQYARMQIGGRHLKILSQSLKTKRNDSCVHFLVGDQEDAFGLVYKILVNVHDDCVLLLYPLEKLSALSGDLPSFASTVPHIIPVKESRYEIVSSFMYVYMLELSKTSSQSNNNIILSYSFLQYAAA